jgi:hypothetical protein
MIKVSIRLDFSEEMGPVHLKKTGRKGLSAKGDDLETDRSGEKGRTSSAFETLVLSRIIPNLLLILSTPIPEIFTPQGRTFPSRHRTHRQEAEHV